VALTVAPGVSLSVLVESYMLPYSLQAVPVTDNTRLVGIVTIADVMKVPFDQRDRVPVGAVMSGRDALYSVTADTSAMEAIDMLDEHKLEQMPVLDDGQLVGLLTRADVMRQLQIREALTPSR